MGYIVEISRSLSFTYVMNDDGFDWVRLGNTMGWFKLDKKTATRPILQCCTVYHLIGSIRTNTAPKKSTIRYASGKIRTML